MGKSSILPPPQFPLSLAARMEEAEIASAFLSAFWGCSVCPVRCKVGLSVRALPAPVPSLRAAPPDPGCSSSP